MLNFMLEEKDVEGYAVWENKARGEERGLTPQPAGRKELLTLQSRRLLLTKGNDGETVTGYKLLGGDCFNTENAFVEHMTIWRKDKSSKTDVYKPKRHDPAKAFWRDFASLTEAENGSISPGIVNWIARLELSNILNGRQIWLQTVSVKYGEKDFFVDNVFGDGISINSSLFSEIGKNWVARICAVLKKTRNCVWHLKNLARAIDTASGWKEKEHKESPSMEPTASQAYFNLDIPFRRWLAGIDPARDSIEEKPAEWLLLVRRQLLQQGRQMFDGAGEKALTGEKNAIAAFYIFERAIIRNTGKEDLA